jgi:hypothetical protein
MTGANRETERACVKRWAETGPELETLRWREVHALDEATALRASGDLIEAALRVPLPASRVVWSGLVDLQDLLHRRRR